MVQSPFSFILAIEKNWKFNGQLMIKSHKSKTKDYNEKGIEI